METLKAAFKALGRAVYHILEKRSDDLFSFYITSVSVPVYQFFFSLRIADPTFDIIKNTEPFIDIAGVKQPVRLMAEYILSRKSIGPSLYGFCFSV